MSPVLVRLSLVLIAAPVAAIARDSPPGPRNAHGAAYDLRDSSLVLFGGAGTDRVLGDTWRWRHDTWHRLPGSGPDPRTFPAMAYDAARGEVVLFGGNRVLFGDSTHPPAMLGDTWVLRGDRWTRASAAGPSPRAEAAIAYDSGRRRIVLFGGYDLSPEGRPHRLGDTWEWDGIRWSRAADTGPPPRSGAGMAWRPGLGRGPLRWQRRSPERHLALGRLPMDPAGAGPHTRPVQHRDGPCPRLGSPGQVWWMGRDGESVGHLGAAGGRLEAAGPQRARPPGTTPSWSARRTAARCSCTAATTETRCSKICGSSRPARGLRSRRLRR